MKKNFVTIVLVPIILVALVIIYILYKRNEGFSGNAMPDKTCTLNNGKKGTYKCPPNTRANGDSTIINGQCVTCPVGLPLSGGSDGMCKDKNRIKQSVKPKVTPATCS
jgi:hypothetical protein